jgi:hypothetical protein
MHDEEKSSCDNSRFFLYYALFSGIYRTSDEIWIHKRPYEDDLPTVEEIFNDYSYKAIIIPGSHLHV